MIGEECRKKYTELTTERKPTVPETEKQNSALVDKLGVDSKLAEDASEKLLIDKNHTKAKDLDYYSPRYNDEKWDSRDGKKKEKRCKRDKYREKDRDRDREKREDSYGRTSHRSEFTSNSTPTPNSSVASSDLGYGMATVFIFYLMPILQFKKNLMPMKFVTLQEQLLANLVIQILITLLQLIFLHPIM